MTTPSAAANGFDARTGQPELDRCIAAGEWPWPDESST